MDELRRKQEVVDIAKRTFEENPEDPKARLLYGRHLCLEQDDWDDGLKLLSGCDEEPLYRIALIDLDAPSSVMGRMEVADAWHDFSRSSPENAGFAARAIYWYEKCRPEATGLAAVKIEKRIEDLATSGSTALPARSPALSPETLPAGGKRLMGHTGPVADVQLSERGGWLLSGSGNGTIRLWDVATGKVLRRIKAHEKGIRSVQFLPDEKRVASCGWDGTIRVWNLTTSREELKINADPEVVYDISPSPDGASIASVGRDELVHLWSLETGKELARFSGHEGPVLSVQFSPDGKHLVTAGQDRIVRLWYVASKREIERFTGGAGAFLHSVDISPDGQSIVACGYGAWLWKRGNARPQVTFPSRIISRSVTFGAGGSLVALGSDDSTVTVFDSTTGEKVSEFDDHSDLVRCVAFSRDGKFIASGSGGKVVDGKMLVGDDFSICITTDGVR